MSLKRTYSTYESQSVSSIPIPSRPIKQQKTMPGYSNARPYAGSTGYAGGYKGKRSYKPKKTSFVKAVKNIVYRTSELKETNNFHTEQAVTNGANPIYFDFPNPDISARANGRIGNKIHVESLQGTLLFHNNGSAATDDMYVRMIVMEIKQGVYDTNSSITSNLWQPSASGSQDVTAYLDIRDLTARPNTETYRVLRDELILCTVGSSTVASTWMGNGLRRFYVKMSKNLIYKDADTEAATNSRFSVMLLARDAENDGAAISVEASGNLQMKYRDV